MYQEVIHNGTGLLQDDLSSSYHLSYHKEYTTQEKLKILADGAKYDVACTSSGVDRQGKKGELGNSRACGICHSFSADGRCISLLKILMTNHCIYDCKYCVNRVKNDIPRTAFRPEELCELTMEFYRRNYIEGLFLSSGVHISPNHTMELMIHTLQLLREVYHFRGYIHVKAVPGATEDLLKRAGYYADRMSINLELPTEESMQRIAPNKNYTSILRPMEQMTRNIQQHRLSLGKSAMFERSGENRYLSHNIFRQETPKIGFHEVMSEKSSSLLQRYREKSLLPSPYGRTERHGFPESGLSSQMIIGATQETDLHLMRTTQFLYQQYDLRRVFFSAYIPINEDAVLPALGTAPPLKREHRLYQADFLLRNYGFQANELLSEAKPFFHDALDPKCDWAIRHIEEFPVEIQTASYETLLRVPGIGPKSAKRIVQARRYAKLDYPNLKKMGVVLKRAHFFILCNGKQMYHIPVEEGFISTNLIAMEGKQQKWNEDSVKYRQLNLFDDFGVKVERMKMG